MKGKDYSQVIASLTAMCSTAEHCSGEMIEKMTRWEVDEATQARVMEFLIKERYIDDERYCRFFVHDKIRFNHWGRRKIEQALYAKRIDKDLQRKILDEVPDEEYIAALRPLLKSKERSVKARNEYEKMQKLIRFAMGRGFSYDIICQSIENNIEEYSE